MHVAEYVRMAEYEFAVERVGHVGDVESFFFAAYFGVEEDVQEHVAELFAYIRVVVVEQGLGELVDFFNSVGAQRLVGLFGVPWAFHAQNVESVHHTSDSLQLFFSCSHGD